MAREKKQKDPAKEAKNNKPQEKDNKPQEKNEADVVQDQKAPSGEDKPGGKEEKSNKKESQKEKKAKVKEEIERGNKRVKDEKTRYRKLDREIGKKKSSAENAMKEAKECYQKAKKTSSMEEKNRFIQKGDEAYHVWKRLDAEVKKADREKEEIDARIAGAKYALWQKRKAFLNLLNRAENAFVRFWKEHSLIYKAYCAIEDRMQNAEAKVTHADLLKQYDEVRKSQRILQAERSLSADISLKVEKCLNNEKKTEIDKIEELARLCGRTGAEPVAQLNDREVLQFKFCPNPLRPGDGIVEISKREIMLDEQGGAALGKEQSKTSIPFHGKDIVNMSPQQKDALMMRIYGQSIPNLKEAMLQVADLDILAVIHKEQEQELAEARQWDPSQERKAEAPSRTEAERQAAEPDGPGEPEEPGRGKASKKDEAQKTAGEKTEERGKEQPAEKQQEACNDKKTMKDIIHARVNLSDMTKEEKDQVREDLKINIHSAQKKDIPPVSKKEKSKKMVLNSTALVSKIMHQDILFVSKRSDHGTDLEPAAFYDKQTGKQIYILDKQAQSLEQAKSQTPKPLTMEYLKSDKYMEQVAEVFKEKNEKNMEKISSLLNGEPFPKEYRRSDYEATVSKAIRQTILHNGEPAAEVKADKEPVVVPDKRTLVEKIQNGDVLFANDLNKGEKDPNRILVDRESGAALVHASGEKSDEPQPWTEHDFSTKTFIREVQQESARMKEEKEPHQVSTLAEEMEQQYSKEELIQLVADTSRVIGDEGLLIDENGNDILDKSNNPLKISCFENNPEVYEQLRQKQTGTVVVDQEQVQMDDGTEEPEHNHDEHDVHHDYTESIEDDGQTLYGNRADDVMGGQCTDHSDDHDENNTQDFDER